MSTIDETHLMNTSGLLFHLHTQALLAKRRDRSNQCSTDLRTSERRKATYTVFRIGQFDIYVGL